MAQFTFNDFINANIAPRGADHISVYDNKGNELADYLATGKINTFEEAKMFWDTYTK